MTNPLEEIRSALADCLEQAEGCFLHHYDTDPEDHIVPSHIAGARRALALLDGMLEAQAQVERVADAIRTSVARDDEGEYPPLFDLLGFSGENKTRTVCLAAARAAIAAMAAPSPSEELVELGRLSAEATGGPWKEAGHSVHYQHAPDRDHGPVFVMQDTIDLHTTPPVWPVNICEVSAANSVEGFKKRTHAQQKADARFIAASANYVRAALRNAGVKGGE